MATERLLVLGATSAIAHAVARRFAARGGAIHLLARRPGPLEDNALDLRARGAASVTTAPFDALDLAHLDATLDDAWSRHGGFDAVLVAWGTLPDQARCEASVDAALAAFDVNARSVVAALTAIALRMEPAGRGAIAVVSSVAGDRGRASNYVYGAAKAAVTAFSSGLGHRLHARGIRVVTVLPGFVDTPMTAGIAAKGPLWATSDRVARSIERALDRGAGPLYVPWFWRPILAIVRALPWRIFVRTKL
jgi:decaprenylphospho-beta-D-erythro-pentofuranosid-2-ulose 2-reductase